CRATSHGPGRQRPSERRQIATAVWAHFWDARSAMRAVAAETTSTVIAATRRSRCLLGRAWRRVIGVETLSRRRWFPQLPGPGVLGALTKRLRVVPCGQARARLRHTWSVNLPVFFPMPEGREFPDPPRCAFCDELGRPIRPEVPESANPPRLVAGPGLFICERCVRLCTELFE